MEVYHCGSGLCHSMNPLYKCFDTGFAFKRHQLREHRDKICVTRDLIEKKWLRRRKRKITDVQKWFNNYLVFLGNFVPGSIHLVEEASDEHIISRVYAQNNREDVEMPQLLAHIEKQLVLDAPAAWAPDMDWLLDGQRWAA